jgi:hypothetical protein
MLRRSPAPVKVTLSKSFAGITEVKWEKEDGNYEAGFMQEGKNMSVIISPSGSLLETETMIKPGELPLTAASYLAQNYKSEKVKGAARIKMANGAINYEAEVKGMDVIFDEKGKFIKIAKD